MDLIGEPQHPGSCCRRGRTLIWLIGRFIPGQRPGCPAIGGGSLASGGELMIAQGASKPVMAG